jgi:hypothetical protein
MSSIHHFKRTYEELVGETFVVPRGRLVGAELTVLPFSTAGGTTAKDDTLQLLIEMRARPGAEFETVAASPVLSQYQEAFAKVLAPMLDAAVPDEHGQTPAVAAAPEPIARFRLVHAGTQPPRYHLRLVGL